jgi:hypothetical protein
MSVETKGAYVQGKFCGPNTYVVIREHPAHGKQYLNSSGKWDIVDNVRIFDDPNKAVVELRKAENTRPDIAVVRKSRKR